MVPSLFQKKTLWAAITAFSCVVIFAVIAFAGWLIVSAISYLQPVLIPIAISAILAFLLDPVVRLLEKWRFSRTWAVLTVFFAFVLIGATVILGIVPTVSHQAGVLAKNMPAYTAKAQVLFNQTLAQVKRLSEKPWLQKQTDPETPVDPITSYISTTVDNGIGWLQKEVPNMAVATGGFLHRSVGGFLGVFGFLLSLVLVPIFLFFFLKEGRAISKNWSNYLPLRASPLKSEIVSLFTEINRYLINFFRGQLLVSLIDGALIAICLLVVRLEFALVIGLFVGILGLIPYLGVIICWIPAVIIAAAQFGDWGHPLAVTIIFITVNQLDGLFIAPKIVGESVGLHPLTVIISVLAWSLILGGLLGALLAVPLTASIKVLLKRYFWDRPAATDPKLLEPDPAETPPANPA